MKLGQSFCAAFALGLLSLFSQTTSVNQERALNPNGWNVPDVKKLEFVKAETITLPEIPVELIVESWTAGPESSYKITNLSPWKPKPTSQNIHYIERVRSLTVFRVSKNKTLCFKYTRILEVENTGLSIGGISTYISDLNDDGTYEFQMGNGAEVADRKLLVSILRIKLGLSEEADLVRRIVSSAMREMSN